jgi:BMFP domain-containing protein YqiC
MFTDLKNQIGDKALEAAEFKACLIQAQAENENLQARVQELEALLEEQTKPAEEKGE